jgi:hypothetical protein
MVKRTPRVVIKVKNGEIKDILTYIEPKVEFLILNEDVPEDDEKHTIFWITDFTSVEDVMKYFPEYHRFD